MQRQFQPSLLSQACPLYTVSQPTPSNATRSVLHNSRTLVTKPVGPNVAQVLPSSAQPVAHIGHRSQIMMERQDMRSSYVIQSAQKRTSRSNSIVMNKSIPVVQSQDLGYPRRTQKVSETYQSMAEVERQLQMGNVQVQEHLQQQEKDQQVIGSQMNEIKQQLHQVSHQLEQYKNNHQHQFQQIDRKPQLHYTPGTQIGLHSSLHSAGPLKSSLKGGTHNNNNMVGTSHNNNILGQSLNNMVGQSLNNMVGPSGPSPEKPSARENQLEYIKKVAELEEKMARKRIKIRNLKSRVQAQEQEISQLKSRLS